MNNCQTLMLVDDDDDDQVIFTSVIHEIDANINCKCFDNAIDSLETLRRTNEKPDCIFVDLNLPLMHGFEFLETIKSSKEFFDIPVIIYSTSSAEADKIKAKNLGATNFLIKPSSFTELKNKVTILLTTVCCTDN